MSLDFSSLVRTLWDNPSEKIKFEDSPKEYLIEKGEVFPANAKVFAHFASDKSFYLVLPKDISELPDVSSTTTDVIKKALSDDSFKHSLISDPNTCLAQNGLDIPKGTGVKVFQNSENEFHVVIPGNPASSELSDSELSAAAGGKNAKTQAICAGSGGGVSIGCGIAAFFTAGATAIASTTVGIGIAAGSVAGTYVNQ